MLGTRIRGYVLCLFALVPLALGMLFNAPEVLVTPAVVLNVVLLVIGVNVQRWKGQASGAAIATP